MPVGGAGGEQAAVLLHLEGAPGAGDGGHHQLVVGEFRTVGL